MCRTHGYVSVVVCRAASSCRTSMEPLPWDTLNPPQYTLMVHFPASSLTPGRSCLGLTPAPSLLVTPLSSLCCRCRPVSLSEPSVSLQEGVKWCGVLKKVWLQLFFSDLLSLYIYNSAHYFLHCPLLSLIRGLCLLCMWSRGGTVFCCHWEEACVCFHGALLICIFHLPLSRLSLSCFPDSRWPCLLLLLLRSLSPLLHWSVECPLLFSAVCVCVCGWVCMACAALCGCCVCCVLCAVCCYSLACVTVLQWCWCYITWWAIVEVWCSCAFCRTVYIFFW